ncbi:hypothetical protein [Saccharothrix sp. ALI-22-I]|uniref:hypothetical protein n=1 Tax=Saccharothrix sp. ALI-22-I TaxID=1933778 RepID=UPI001179E460|nr:hypothetical protein [Saccharothrix sp. ALI-22-I]
MKDSTRLLNSNNPNGLLVQHDNITDVGVHIGGYQPQAVGYLAFTAMVATGDQFDCTPRTLVPLATVLPQ